MISGNERWNWTLKFFWLLPLLFKGKRLGSLWVERGGQERQRTYAIEHLWINDLACSMRFPWWTNLIHSPVRYSWHRLVSASARLNSLEWVWRKTFRARHSRRTPRKLWEIDRWHWGEIGWLNAMFFIFVLTLPTCTCLKQKCSYVGNNDSGVFPLYLVYRKLTHNDTSMKEQRRCNGDE